MRLFLRGPSLRQRARWRYEIGRLRASLPVAAYAVGLTVLAVTLSGAPWRCATLGATLSGLSIVCCWLGGSAARGWVHGLVLGSGLLVALACTRLAWDAPCLVDQCAGDCLSFSILSGVLAGAGFLVVPQLEARAFWACALVALSLAVGLTFIVLGANCLYLFAGAAAGALARLAH